jgi:hypothetical protein
MPESPAALYGKVVGGAAYAKTPGKYGIDTANHSEYMVNHEA